MAKLKAEFLQAYYARRPRPLGHLLVKNVHRLSPLAARFARLVNWLARRPWVRGLMEGVAGIDRRRSLPELHRDHFRRWFARRPTPRRRLRARSRFAGKSSCSTTASPRSRSRTSAGPR